MSNWFYISRWSERRWNLLGSELSKKEAEFLFKSMLSYDSKKYYFALLKKENKWKVVNSKIIDNDWLIIDTNS